MYNVFGEISRLSNNYIKSFRSFKLVAGRHLLKNSPNGSTMELEDCMYSNIKNRRYNFFQTGDKILSKYTSRLKDTKYKRKNNSEVLIKLDGIKNYKYPHRVVVEYPAINYLNKYGTKNTNITDKLVSKTLIKDEMEITEIKQEEPQRIRNNIEPCNFLSKRGITNVSTDLRSNVRSYRVEDDQLNNKQVHTSVKPDCKDLEYTLSFDSGISCEYSLSNEDEQVSKNCMDSERSTLYFENIIKKKTDASMETSNLQQSFISSASTCTKENLIKSWKVNKNESTIHESDNIIFDVSKCEHSTPQKERNRGLISTSSMNKLCKSIMDIEKKVDQLQLNSIASDVAQAVHLVQILHRDLERNYIPSKHEANSSTNLDLLSQIKVNDEEFNKNKVLESEDGGKDETFFSCNEFEGSTESRYHENKIDNPEVQVSSSWGQSTTVCQQSRYDVTLKL